MSEGAISESTNHAADTVSSPCINVCRMNPNSGWCEGCWRTLDEICVWSKASTETKHTILALVSQRQDLVFQG
jgi:predicted Fe-S protein YdhL (DUF1289 family)